MPLWRSTDVAANSAIYAPAQVKQAPNTTNRNALFGNATSNAYFDGVTIGQFGVSSDEVRVLRETANVSKPPHAGWVLKTEGQGGRAGRVTYETLVAMHSLTGDASDDTDLPDFSLSIVTQPEDASGNTDNDDVVTFTVVAGSIPSGATFTYQWQKWDSGNTEWEDLSDAGAYSNTDTDELSVLANTASDGEIYRVEVGSDGGAANVFSANAVLTVTTA